MGWGCVFLMQYGLYWYIIIVYLTDYAMHGMKTKGGVFNVQK